MPVQVLREVVAPLLLPADGTLARNVGMLLRMVQELTMCQPAQAADRTVVEKSHVASIRSGGSASSRRRRHESHSVLRLMALLACPGCT